MAQANAATVGDEVAINSEEEAEEEADAQVAVYVAAAERNSLRRVHDGIGRQKETQEEEEDNGEDDAGDEDDDDYDDDDDKEAEVGDAGLSAADSTSASRLPGVRTEVECALAAKAVGMDSVQFTRFVEGHSVKSEILWTAENVGRAAHGSQTCPDDANLLRYFRGGYGGTQPCECDPEQTSLNCLGAKD